jgi:CRISPR-associated endonuclease/helicase Cas3
MMDTLNKLYKKGLNIDKETHPKKSYRQHVEEVRKFVEKMTREIYKYSEEFVAFATLLSEMHDVGKLLPEWSLTQENRPWHAIEGAEWFLNYATVEDVNNYCELYHDILGYAILTHHSILHTLAGLENIIERAEKIEPRHFTKYSKCRTLVKFSGSNILSLVKKLDLQFRVNLADVIGIVKVADMLSAKNLIIDNVLQQYHWVENFEQKLVNSIVKGAEKKRGNFDQSKFEKQRKLASSKERHLIIAAPTGWGKTALALLRIANLKPFKIFYILPTITAIKDFYGMFTKILEETYIGEYFYFADVEVLEKINYEEENPIEIYRYFIPKITLTTIDQILLTLLQIGKYHIRRFNFKNSLLIFDEFHLLTPAMLGCLKFLLNKLAEHYNFSCLFMSATPSPIYTELLKHSLPQLKIEKLEEEYSYLKRHKIEFCSDKKVDDLILEKQDILEKKSTLILVNTVRKAQKLYKDLKGKQIVPKNKNIVLLHADFAYKDRSEKEKEVSKADILISTQVAEVSLDTSFELLITELSPIPSLIQRFGRVNRYGRTTEGTNVFICKPDSDEPYKNILLNLAYKNLPTLLNGIEKKGEQAYLDDEFWQYEQIYEKEVEDIEENIAEKMENMLNFFSFIAKEDEILQMLGREETYLGLPKIYFENVVSLFRMLKDAKYDEYRKLYASIKKYLAPLSRSDIKNKRAEWDDELRMYVITTNYDKEIGIVRIPNY